LAAVKADASGQACPRAPDSIKRGGYRAIPGSSPKGEASATLGESPEQGLVLNMKDKEGRTRIELRVRPDGTPVLQFLDAQGEVIQQLPEPGKNKG
jgi:hypothetical protein